MSALEIAEALCESPIEVQMLSALAGVAAERDVALVLRTSSVLSAFNFGSAGRYWITPQYESAVLPYRFDFLISPDDPRLPSLVIECDGHDFHERTKYQAARDKSRDRETQTWGAHVFRFTGSEIHRDARACAEQCFRFMEEAA